MILWWSSCGKENKVIDALSRREEWIEEADQTQLTAITLAVATRLEDLKPSYEDDIEIEAILKILEAKLEKKRFYALKEGILLYKGKIFLSQNVPSVPNSAVYAQHLSWWPVRL